MPIKKAARARSIEAVPDVLRFDAASGEYLVRFDVEAVRPSEVAAAVVAEVHGESLQWSPSVGEAVDSDALDAVLRSSARSVTARFAWSGYEFVIESSGRLTARLLAEVGV